MFRYRAMGAGVSALAKLDRRLMRHRAAALAVQAAIARFQGRLRRVAGCDSASRSGGWPSTGDRATAGRRSLRGPQRLRRAAGDELGPARAAGGEAERAPRRVDGEGPPVGAGVVEVHRAGTDGVADRLAAGRGVEAGGGGEAGANAP